MAFSKKYREKALELYHQYSTEGAFQHLAKEFPDISTPVEKTLKRWRDSEENKIELARQKTKQHLYQLSSVVKTILSGGLRGIKRTKDGSYEYDRFDDGYGGIGSFSMNLEEVKKTLHQNIEKAYDKHRDYNLFDYFLIHLTSSISGFPNPDKADLHKLADASPLELIEALKMLALKKDFKGKCPVCKD